jgi:hypothetical protein
VTEVLLGPVQPAVLNYGYFGGLLYTEVTQKQVNHKNSKPINPITDLGITSYS